MKQIVIEPTGSDPWSTDYVLIVDGARVGIYSTEKGAKAAARRFIQSYQRLEWVYGQSGMCARIYNKR